MSATTQLRLRSDLIVSRQESGGQVSIVVKDPLSQKFFRFQEVEWFAAEQLATARSLDEVGQAIERQFGAELDTDSLTQFLATLEKYGLLDTGKAPKVRAPRPLVVKDFFYMRLKAFDPGPLFAVLIERVRFMFTPQFMTLSAAMILFAVFLTASSWDEIVRDFSQLNLLVAVLMAWATIIVVGVLHEFAHGLTCTHFGGQVREVGFYFIYLNPALYCNVSDAWLFPKKSQRLWVMLAGSWFELFLWALATFMWRLTDTGTAPNTIALVVMATSGIKTLFNFNPLIKLDGYYLLSDSLEITNLRKKSLSYMGSWFTRWFTGKQVEDGHTPRERVILVLYGVTSTVYILLFLWFVAVRLGGTLVPKYQFMGFLIMLGLLGLRLRRRLRRFFPNIGRSPVTPGALTTAFAAGTGADAAAAPDGSAAAPPTETPDAPTSDRGRRSSRSSKDAKSATPPPKRGGLIGFLRDPKRGLATAGVLCLLLFGGCMELKVTGDISVLPKHNADVHARVDGLVEKVLVTEGTPVDSGAVLARLSAREYRTELAKVSADLAERQARLRMLEVGTRPEEVEMARSEVARLRLAEQLAVDRFEKDKQQHAERLVVAQSTLRKTEERLKYARANLERIKALRDAEVLSQREYEQVAEDVAIRETEYDEALAELNIVTADNLSDAQRSLASSQRDLAQAQERLQLMEAGTRPEEVDATRAEVDRLETERNYLSEQLQMTEVRSPIKGVVTTPARTLSEMEGRFVKKGDLIAEVYELRTIMAEIEVPEKEIADVHVGQKVLVKARAYPNHVFEGTVTSIATTAHGPVGNNAGATGATRSSRGTPGARNILVTTQLDNSSMLLKPEMTGKAKILCGRRQIADLMLRRVSRTFRVEFWSWW